MIAQVIILLILFKGSSQKAGLKKRVAIKKLQLEEIDLEKKIKSKAMPSLTELVNGGIIEQMSPEEVAQSESTKDVKNRSKIGF